MAVGRAAAAACIRVARWRPAAWRGVGSGPGCIEKDGARRKEDIGFPERAVTVYTCQNVYEEWRRRQKFLRVPESGVFAQISYVDTKDPSRSGNQRPSKTVLCIHGIPGNYRVFSHLIKDLSREGVRVIVPTFPSTLYLPGKYKDELFRHSVEEKTQVLKDFLEALEIA